MSTFTFKVDCYTGHYHVPSVVSNGSVIPSFPIAPPSTIYGFLYSLMGIEKPYGEMEFAYGWASQPPKHMLIVGRKTHHWADDPEKKIINPNITRFTKLQMYWAPSYYISVRGEFADQVRKACLEGMPHDGILYLGTSDDAVSSIEEVSEDVENHYWVSPAARKDAKLGALTVSTPPKVEFHGEKATQSFGRVEAKYGHFTYSGQKHYFTLGGSK